MMRKVRVVVDTAVCVCVCVCVRARVHACVIERKKTSKKGGVLYLFHRLHWQQHNTLRLTGQQNLDLHRMLTL